MLSLVGFVTAVISAITGAVLSTSKNGSSLPQELMIMAILGIRKMEKNLFIFFSAPKMLQKYSEFEKLSYLLIYSNCQELMTK